MKFVFVFIMVSLLSTAAWGRVSRIIFEAGKFFDSADEDNNGILNVDEQLKKAEKMDTDHNGWISNAEAVADAKGYYTIMDEIITMLDMFFQYVDNIGVAQEQLFKDIKEIAGLGHGDEPLTKEEYKEFVLKMIICQK